MVNKNMIKFDDIFLNQFLYNHSKNNIKERFYIRGYEHF